MRIQIIGAESPGVRSLRCWGKSAEDLCPDMHKRWTDLSTCFGDGIVSAEGCTAEPLSFACAVPHGSPGSALGSVMMTRIESGAQVFVHASDIQPLDDATVARRNSSGMEQVLPWSAMQALIKAHYYREEARGPRHAPIGLERTLRMYSLQQ